MLKQQIGTALQQLLIMLLIAALICIFIVLMIEMRQEPVTAAVTIEVDGINCVIAEMPTLTYYVTTDSVRVTIECDSDILMHYLPATE